jgi:hypothetical protein
MNNNQYFQILISSSLKLTALVTYKNESIVS